MAELDRVEVMLRQSGWSTSQCTPVAERMAVDCRSEINVGIWLLLEEVKSSDRASKALAHGLSWSRTSYKRLAEARSPGPDCSRAKSSNAWRSSCHASVVWSGVIRLLEI